MAGRSLASAAAALVEVATGFHRRGWMLGTSGNLSVVLEREPLRLAITASGLDKGTLGLAQILPVDQDGRVLEGRPGKASDETALHLVLVRDAGAASVLHTHSVWGTILSDAHAAAGGFAIEGYEMLKGLAGVRTHEHREWIPILENTQDYAALSAAIKATLEKHPLDPDPPPRPLRLGQRPCRGQASRRDPGVPVRSPGAAPDGRGRARRGGVTMATVRIPSEGATLTEPGAVRERLAVAGIVFERWHPSHPVAAEAPAEEVLAARRSSASRRKAASSPRT